MDLRIIDSSANATDKTNEIISSDDDDDGGSEGPGDYVTSSQKNNHILVRDDSIGNLARKASKIRAVPVV